MNVRALPLLLVVALSVSPRFSLSEDVKPEGKGDTPVPAAQEKKPDEVKKAEPKAEQGPPAPNGEFDPKTVIGTPPTYPLKSDNFENIEDGYEIKETTTGKKKVATEEQTSMETNAKQDIFNALLASSQEYLVQNINPKLTYSDLMQEAEKY